MTMTNDNPGILTEKKAKEIYFVVSCLLRCLNHKVRTPLSIISSEVYALNYNLSEEHIHETHEPSNQEINKVVQEQIRRSAQILKEANLPGSSEITLRPVLLADIMVEAFKLTEHKIPKLLIDCDPEKMISALSGVAELMHRRIDTFTVSATTEDGRVAIYLDGGKVGSQPKFARSLSAWLIEGCNLQDPLPALCDLTFICHNSEIKVGYCENGISITIYLS